MSQPRDRAGKFGRTGHTESNVSLPPAAAPRYDLKTPAAVIDLQTFAGWAAEIVAAGRDAYDGDLTRRLAGEAIISRFGEAVNRVSEEFKSDHPGIPWRAIRAVRNVGAHEYDLVDHDANWAMLATGMPMIIEKLSSASR